MAELTNEQLNRLSKGALNFSGILVTDGYQVYHTLAKEREDLIAAGCWIHTRRPYAEFIKALQRNENPTEGTIAEQAIRPFTLGRKNFVIIDTSKVAQASAILYSLVETAKVNHLNPYKYFELLLTELPNHAEDEDPSYLDDLLPWSKRIQKNCLSQINRPKKS